MTRQQKQHRNQKQHARRLVLASKGTDDAGMVTERKKFDEQKVKLVRIPAKQQLRRVSNEGRKPIRSRKVSAPAPIR